MDEKAATVGVRRIGFVQGRVPLYAKPVTQGERARHHPNAGDAIHRGASRTGEGQKEKVTDG